MNWRHQMIIAFLVVVVFLVVSAGMVWAGEGVTPAAPIPTSTPIPTPTPQPESPLDRAKDIVETLKNIAELTTKLKFDPGQPLVDFEDFFQKAVKTGTDFGKTWTSPDSKLFPNFEDDSPWNIFRETFSQEIIYKRGIPVLLVAICVSVWMALRKGEALPNFWLYLLIVVFLGLFTQASGRYLAAVTGMGSSLVQAAGGQSRGMFPHTDVWSTLFDLLLGLSRGGKLMFLILIVVSMTFGLQLVLKTIRRFLELALAGTFMGGIVSASLLKDAFVTRSENPKSAIGWVVEFGRILLEIVIFGMILQFMITAAVSKQLASYAGWVIIAAIMILDKWPEKILAIGGFYKLQEKLQESDEKPRNKGTADEGLHVTPERLQQIREERQKDL